MKRVLLVAYHFPPDNEIGAIRPRGLYRYLPEFGWEVLVLTPKKKRDPANWPGVVETGYVDVIGKWKSRFGLRSDRSLQEQMPWVPSGGKDGMSTWGRFRKLVGDVVAFPDRQCGWMGDADAAVRCIARQYKIDAIISTAVPFTCHLVGRRAKARLGCPWVADFRDPWSLGYYYNYGLLQRFLPAYEAATLRTADEITIVSEPWAAAMRKRYPEVAVECITNGFDPSEFSGLSSAPTEEFSISHTGALHHGRKDPAMLFDVISRLIKANVIHPGKLAIRFYGARESWLDQEIESFGLSAVVQQCGNLRRDEVLRAQTGAHILLALLWDNPMETGMLPGKVFEYLGARRPILAVGGSKGALAQMLELSHAGEHIVARERLEEVITGYYAEYERTGRVDYRPDEMALSQYTHRHMAGEFARMLDRLVAADVAGAEVSGKVGLVDQEYWDKRNEHMAMKEVRADDPIRNWIISHVPPGQGSAFEIGCYPGRYLAILGDLGYELHGMDRTPYVSPRVADWLASCGLRVGHICCADFTTAPMPRRYDVVASFGFVEHYTDWAEIIARQASLVEDGGWLVVAAPNFAGWVQRGLHSFLDGDNMRRHCIGAMNPHEWAQVVAPLGFEVHFSGWFGGFRFWVDNSRQTLLHRSMLEVINRAAPLVRFLPDNARSYSAYCGLVARRRLRAPGVKQGMYVRP
jgi:SAM-dependent methyltransferase